MAGPKSGLRFALSVAAQCAVITLATSPLGAQGIPALYKTKCANCHGVDGKGNTPAGRKTKVHDFTSAEVQKMTDAELMKVIEAGKNKMPSYKTKLTSDQMTELLKYVRTLGKNN